MIKKFMSFSRKKKIVVAVGAIVLLFVLFSIFKNGKVQMETVTVKVGDFIKKVTVSGKVVPASSVDLGFKTGGRVARVYFSVGDVAKKGQILVGLDSADAKGALDVAKANYEKVLNGATITDIDVVRSAADAAKIALDQAKIEQDLAVANARRGLLNSGFMAVSDSQFSSDTAPTISGTYLKDTEGQIVIEEYSSSGGSSFKTSGLVTAYGIISITTPQPIGDTGLYIKYASTNNSTKWIVNIPNIESAGYLASYNAYQAALSTRTQVVANAEAALSQANSALTLKQSSARPEDVAAAQGAVTSAEGAYNDKFVISPFDGVITRMDAKPGEVVSPNASEVSMMSAGVFQIESYVPEVNIALIKIGQDADITLDAYGSDVVFKAKVVSVDPAETIRDGVSTYKTKLQFDNLDDRIKSGMTANISVITFNKQGVIVIPKGVIFEKDGLEFVQVKKDRRVLDVPITTNSVSSLGQVEVTSGLSEGNVVLLNPIVK